MHNMMQKKFGKKFDLGRLGYPKLKNFLQEIEGVYFDHGDNVNHIKARYKSPLKKKPKKVIKKTVVTPWEGEGDVFPEPKVASAKFSVEQTQLKEKSISLKGEKLDAENPFLIPEQGKKGFKLTFEQDVWNDPFLSFSKIRQNNFPSQFYGFSNLENSPKNLL